MRKTAAKPLKKQAAIEEKPKRFWKGKKGSANYSSEFWDRPRTDEQPSVYADMAEMSFGSAHRDTRSVGRALTEMYGANSLQ